MQEMAKGTENNGTVTKAEDTMTDANSKAERARKFAKGFNSAGKGMLQMLETAMLEKYPKALGMTPQEFVNEATKGHALKLPKQERQKEAKRLVEKGLSQREAASVLGVDQATVARDVNASKPKPERPDITADEPDVDASASPKKQRPDETEEEKQARIDRVNLFSEIELLYQVNKVATLMRGPKHIEKTVTLIRNHKAEYIEFAKHDIDNLIGALQTIEKNIGVLISRLETNSD